MSIPVFHDDQHGTAIIAGAGLINALEIIGGFVAFRAGRGRVGCTRTPTTARRECQLAGLTQQRTAAYCMWL